MSRRRGDHVSARHAFALYCLALTTHEVGALSPQLKKRPKLSVPQAVAFLPALDVMQGVKVPDDSLVVPTAFVDVASVDLIRAGLASADLASADLATTNLATTDDISSDEAGPVSTESSRTNMARIALGLVALTYGSNYACVKLLDEWVGSASVAAVLRFSVASMVMMPALGYLGVKVDSRYFAWPFVRDSLHIGLWFWLGYAVQAAALETSSAGLQAYAAP